MEIEKDAGHGQNSGGQARVAAHGHPGQPAAQGNAPKRDGGATFAQEPAGERANLGNALRHGFRHAQIISAMECARSGKRKGRPVRRPRATWIGRCAWRARPALKMVGQLERRGVESSPIATAGDAWKSEPMVNEVAAAMQENDHRPFLPVLGATIKPAVNDVVLRKAARSRRGKVEMQSGWVGVEFDPRRLAFRGNKVGLLKKLERFFQPGVLSAGGWQRQGHELNGPPVKIFGQGAQIMRGDNPIRFVTDGVILSFGAKCGRTSLVELNLGAGKCCVEPKMALSYGATGNFRSHTINMPVLRTWEHGGCLSGLRNTQASPTPKNPCGKRPYHTFSIPKLHHSPRMEFERPLSPYLSPFVPHGARESDTEAGIPPIARTRGFEWRHYALLTERGMRLMGLYKYATPTALRRAGRRLAGNAQLIWPDPIGGGNVEGGHHF